jgi:hypothetical protein
MTKITAFILAALLAFASHLGVSAQQCACPPAVDAPPAAVPAYLASAPVGQWYAISNGTPSSSAQLLPTDGGYMGGQKNITDAWGGMAIVNGKLVLDGGGHTDYGGNEKPVFDLDLDWPAWSLAITRTPVPDLLGGSNYYRDGRPTARHTYYSLWGIGDVLYRFNGWSGFAYNGTPVGGAADVRTEAVDTFDLTTSTYGSAGSVCSIQGSETGMGQDATTGDVYAWGKNNVIYRWRASDQTCSVMADLPGTEGNGGAVVVDTVNQRVVRFAGRAGAKITAWPMGTSQKLLPTPIGPDAADIANLAGTSNHGWGVAHDTDRNDAYLMNNAGAMWKIRLADFYVERMPPAPVLPVNGIWGRLKYHRGTVFYLARWNAPLHAMLLAP